MTTLKNENQNWLVGQKTAKNFNPFNCCLIGDDMLLVSCGDVLLNKKHEIVWIVSKNPAIKHWASNHSIPCFESMTDAQRLSSNFDYLFSIANGKILRDDELQLPRKFTINYHYSFLPRYAGTYATSWAILNEEKTHGITWHVMTKEIDGGDILKQKQFSISKDETALTLNLKCFEQAIQTFEELITELENGTYVLKKQDMSMRSYFPLKKRPPQNGVIFWHQPAQDIYKLHRALTFGKYFNQLGILKLLIETEIFHIKSLKISDIHSIVAPGTVINFSDKELQVSTTTFDILISEICNLEGTIVSLSNLVERFKIKIGYQLPIPEQAYFEQLEQVASRYVRFEQYWVEAFAKITPGKEVFFVSPKDKNYNLKQVMVTKVPNSIYQNIANTREVLKPEDLLLAAILIYFYRLNSSNNFSIIFSYPDLPLASGLFKQYYATGLPFTSEFSATMTFREALTSVIEQLNSLKRHQNYTRDINQRYPQLAHCLDINLINIEVVADIKSYTPKQAPLCVVIMQDGSEIGVFVDEYILSLKHLSTLINHFSSHILELLAGATKDLEQTISQLPLITPFERQQILINWNDTTVSHFKNKTVVNLFEAQVLKTPQRTAVVFNDLCLTFEDLNKKANQLAYFLRRHGVASDKLVAICIERSLEMVIAILAVLKAGGAYIPLDTKHPISRLSYILEDSQAGALLLSNSKWKNSFKDFNGNIIDLTQQQQEIGGQPKSNLKQKIPPDSLAYVIYTSGTTGNPKGVAIPHSALANHMLWMILKFNFTEDNIFLQKTPFSFDASIWEFFSPLISGGKLIMAINGEPNEIIAFVKKYKVNVLQLVPSLLRQLLENPELQACNSLQQVFVGGEALFPSTVQLFFKHMPQVKLHNLYGPTETTIEVITHSYQPHQVDSLDTIYIGKPISNVQAYVLDTYLNPVPVGLTGELYLGGQCLARGYLNRDELTKARFISNPFEQSARSKLYKTGDIVRWLPEGELEYIGRLDEQVKFNGFRIELSEIESTLLQHKDIQDCAVLIQERSNDHDNLSTTKSLVAFYIKKQHIAQLNTQECVKNWNSLADSSANHSLVVQKRLENQPLDEIKEFMRQRLPSYMLPSCYIPLEKMPLNLHGKVDKSVLLEFKITRTGEYLAPENDTEVKMCNIWAEVLGLSEDNISINDDFFDLGGHSLAALRVLSLTKKFFCIQLPTRTLFEYPTIKKLALFVERVLQDPTLISQQNLMSSPLVVLQKNGFKAPLFMVHPLGGTIFWYKTLSRHLGNTRPLYAIQDPAIQAQELLFNSLEEMASFYLKSIREVQPKGPYLLAGASFGGTVVVEITYQLLKMKERVNFVGLIDAWPVYFEKFWQKDFLEKLMLPQLEREAPVSGQYIDNLDFLLSLYQHRVSMLRNYKIPMIETELTFFKAMEIWPAFKEMTLSEDCWKPYSNKEIDIQLVPGNHETMFWEPQVQLLAKKINLSLEKVEKRTSHFINYRHVRSF